MADPRHEEAAALVLAALDGPQGPKVATSILHTWLHGGVEGVDGKMVRELVERWPYARQVQELIGQVEHLSVLEHLQDRVRGLNPHDREVVTNLGRQFGVMTYVRDYLRRKITDPNARASLGLDPKPEANPE